MVDADPGRPVRVEPVPLRAGRRLVDFTGTLEELRAQAAQIGDAFVRAVIVSEQPILNLAAAAKDAAPQATFVSIDPRCDASQVAILDRTEADGDEPDLPDLFRDYLSSREPAGGGRRSTSWRPSPTCSPTPTARSPGSSARKPCCRRSSSEETRPAATGREGAHLRPGIDPQRAARSREGAGMRPLQLSFSGIRSYPGAVGPLDFTGKTLIAILGDTGAGKSTILEAITLGPVRQLHLDRP